MIKKVLTTISMAFSGIGFSQPAGDVAPVTVDPELSAQLEAEIKDACGHFLPGTADFKECVQIVTVDFTVFPHNRGGVVCPGSACREQSNVQ